ncbi:glycosyltransferase family 4 protein [Corynebacterium aurimucosum]|uniref:glycosyltransferase family 4 protein n=2 Tax=Corynebacterium aurimucosum TaxID=169292 RepID=UPI0031DD6082
MKRNRSLKILVLSQYWFPEQGVPQRRWQWLASTLIGQGAEIMVVAPPPHYRREKTWKNWGRRILNGRTLDVEVGPSGEKILRCPYIPATHSLTQRVLNQFVVACGMVIRVFPRASSPRGFAPDLVIGTVPALPTAAVTLFVSKLLRVPYIIDLRDAWPDLLHVSSEWNQALGKKSLRQKLLERGPKQALLRVVERVLWLVYSRADAMIFTSRHLQDSIMRILDLRAHSRPEALLIRNVFPTPQLKSAKKADDEGVAFAPELRILYAGTVGRAQNLGNLLEAIDIAVEGGVDVKVKILGKGDALSRLKDTWNDKSGSVEFEQPVSPEKMSEYYAWADCAVVHLADWEALQRAVPSKTYELMERGVFIIGVVNGETASLIQGLGAGQVVPPNQPVLLAEKIKELAGDRHLLELQGEAQAWVVKERKIVETEIIPRILEKND